MNQIKIGKFIAECRKEKNLTQTELADKLNITNKAISKWETGNGTPDVSILLELCNELGITVNELLSGERIKAEDYKEKAEENIINAIRDSDTKIKKKNKIVTAVIIVATIYLLIAIITTISILGKVIFSPRELLEYEDVLNYENYLYELKNTSRIGTGLLIFPEKINKDEVINFKYTKDSPDFELGYSMYLVMDYDNDTYLKETERIKNLSAKFKNFEKKPLYTENGFEYPAYITIFDGGYEDIYYIIDKYNTFEYVLLDEQNTMIIYVFSKYLSWSELKIDEKYLPKNYDVSQENKDNKRTGYNMYYYYLPNGDGIFYND